MESNLRLIESSTAILHKKTNVTSPGTSKEAQIDPRCYRAERGTSPSALTQGYRISHVQTERSLLL